MDDYLPVDEFAKRLHIDEMSVRRLIAQRKIRAIDVGTEKRKRLRIPPSEFARMEKELAI